MNVEVIAADLTQMTGPLHQLRCYGHEKAGRPHIMVSAGDCYPEGCLHMSAVAGPDADALANVAAYLEMETFWSHVKQATFQACRRKQM